MPGRKHRWGSRGILNSRVLRCEPLESRCLLASDWQNSFNPYDVDNSGEVVPIDALLVINNLLREGSRTLDPDQPGSPAFPYIDVDGSGSVEPLDVLRIFNYLNDAGAPRLPVPFTTQRFRVDTTTGDVLVTEINANPTNGSEGEALLTGKAIKFNTSQLLNQQGNTGRRVLNVSITNNSGETLGKTPDGLETGLRVLFGPFTPQAPSSDLRTKTSVRTFAGTGVPGSTNGPALAATFNDPRDVVVDSKGILYVTDFVGHKVRKINDGIVSTLAGSGVAGGVNGVGGAASFNNPWGIAINPVDGALIVTDNTGNRVRRVTSTGEVTTIAGTGGVGDTNGAGSVATFRGPAGVAVDSTGAIYIAEANGHRIRKIVKTPGADPTLATSYSVSVFAGSTASPPVSGSTNATGSAARFNSPRDIAVDSTGVLYVADSTNNRIRRITSTGAVTTIAGTGVGGTATGAGNVATFFSPQGIALVDDDTLLVSDTTGQKVRQVRLTNATSPHLATSWLVQAIAGPPPGIHTPGFVNGDGNLATFANPRGIAVDGQNAYVADSNNDVIRRIASVNGFPVRHEPVQLANADYYFPVPTGRPPVRDGSRPYVKYSGSVKDGATSAIQPWVLVIPSDVTVFEFTVTVEANTEFLATPVAVSNPGPLGVGPHDNMVRTVAGGPLSGFVNGLATEARFAGLSGIAIDKEGNRYVADSGNRTIRRISADGFVSSVAGRPGPAASLNGNGAEALFGNPMDVAIAPDGKTLFVTDFQYHTVRRIALTGEDPTKPTSWWVSTVAGLVDLLAYVDETTGEFARFNRPSGIAVSEGGIIYVTEVNGNRVRRIQQIGFDPTLPSSWWVSLVAGDTSGPFGAPGTTDDNGYLARFNAPSDIAVDRTGMLYVADYGNNRIRRITPDGDVSTLAGSVNGYADGIGTNALFDFIYSVAVDSAGYVYVGTDHHVRRISPSGVVTTVAGTSTAGLFLDHDGTADVAEFWSVTGIAVDASGALHILTGSTYESDSAFSQFRGLRVRMISRVLSSAG